jgi:threonine synthase
MSQKIAINLMCTSCGSEILPESGNYSCPKCKGILQVRYSRGAINKELISSHSSRSGVWKYFEMLPVESRENIVSLEEGNTPLIRTESLGAGYYVKDETRNPTGSFKDRPNTVGISKAIELGAKTIAIASSGNAAGSLSAYAAKAKLQCIVCVPEDTPDSKLKQIMVFGAKVAKVKGTYSDSFNLIRESCKRYGWHNLTSVCTANPYQVEGDKTAAYEIYERLNNPDWVLIPLGAGPLLVGIYRGFLELQEAGLIEKIPRLIGVQAEECAPIVRAFKNGDRNVLPWEGKPHTVAHSIADPLTGYSEDGTLTLEKIRESNGVAESVNDEEMMEAVWQLARGEGIFAEPAAASTLAAANKLKKNGIISNGDKVVMVVTGTGLKSQVVLDQLRPAPAIDPDPDQLVKIMK